MRIALLWALVFAALAPAAAHPFAGEWRGKGHTLSYPDRFAMRIRIFADGSAKVAYRGIGGGGRYECDGLLLPMGAPKTGLTFREKITAGPCIDGATVTLRRKAAHFAWFWRGQQGGRRVIATGAVSRMR